jgi:hypothetical protein
MPKVIKKAINIDVDAPSRISTKPIKKRSKSSKKPYYSANSIESSSRAISTSKWLEDYPELYTNRLSPISEAFINRLAEDLIKWVEGDEKALMIREFIALKKLDQVTYNVWVKKYQYLGRAHAYAKLILGIRRERGLLNRTLEPTWTAFMMPFYDSEWKEIAEWRNNMRKEVAAVEAQKVVIMDQLKTGEYREIVRVENDALITKKADTSV